LEGGTEVSCDWAKYMSQLPQPYSELWDTRMCKYHNRNILLTQWWCIMSVADRCWYPDKHLSLQKDKVDQIERLVMFVFCI